MRTALAIIAALVLVSALFWFAFRPWYARWGATAAEVGLRLPGDDIAPDANMISTRAVTVHAAPEKVYPWLAPIGYRRAGMYSYEWLENLVGCDLHNLYRIAPGLQTLTPGQEISMGSKGFPFYRLQEFVSNEHLLLRPGDPATREPGAASWAMVIRPQGDGTSRLIMRQRQRVDPGLGNFVMWRVMIDPISFIMEQKMMRTVRDLAERS